MDELALEVTAEKEHIEKTLLTLSEALSRPEKTVIELAAIGTFVHNVYSGMENILKRILKFEGVTIPDSPSSHKDLLDQSVAAGIISQSLSEELRASADDDKFLNFLADEKLNNEKILTSPVGKSGYWQEYLQGSLDALERIQEILGV